MRAFSLSRLMAAILRGAGAALYFGYKKETYQSIFNSLYFILFFFKYYSLVLTSLAIERSSASREEKSSLFPSFLFKFYFIFFFVEFENEKCRSVFILFYFNSRVFVSGMSEGRRRALASPLCRRVAKRDENEQGEKRGKKKGATCYFLCVCVCV